MKLIVKIVTKNKIEILCISFNIIILRILTLLQTEIIGFNSSHSVPPKKNYASSFMYMFIANRKGLPPAFIGINSANKHASQTPA